MIGRAGAKSAASKRWRFGLVCAACTAWLGCTEGSEPRGEQVYYFSALEQDTFKSHPLLAPRPEVPAEELAQLEAIFESFDANAERLFAQPDIDDRLDSIEHAYMRAGRYFELLAHYRDDIERQGVAKSPAAPRLAWALMRLGQEDQSSELIARLIAARPLDPAPWFLYGARSMNEATTDREAAVRAVLGWREAPRLDPNYRGFEDISAGVMLRQATRYQLQHDIKESELEELAATLRGDTMGQTDVEASAPEAARQGQVSARDRALRVMQRASAFSSEETP